ncbi:MAG: sulfatase [Opitutaceae bacterium]
MKPFSFLLCLAASAMTAVAVPAATAARPNVLFISVDDMNNDLGCYGSTVVKSPHIDRLAARGVRFDRAYCQFPLCSPSRSSIMTGLRPDQTRVFDLRYHFRTGLPGVVTLSQLFMRDGYYTARVGKIYHYGNPGQIGTDGLDDAPSWQEVFNPAGIDKTKLEPQIINHTPKRGLGSSLSFLADKDGRDEDHTDGMVATRAIKLLEQHQKEPFFLAVGFYKPHCPYIAPQKYFDLYSLDSIEVPEVPEGILNTVPEPALSSTRPWPNYHLDRQKLREAKRAYYATISFVDAQIGHVLDALDRLNLQDNTIVVFWSDHGYLLGERGLWMKQSCFEESARVPLIIAGPGVMAGGVSLRNVELVDVYPTLADLAGLTPPILPGVSLQPLLAQPDAAWNRPAFTQVQRQGFPGHSVRTARWRYTEWDGGDRGVELYDHENDPGELKNLANDPWHADVVADHQALVRKNWPIRVASSIRQSAAVWFQPAESFSRKPSSRSEAVIERREIAPGADDRPDSGLHDISGMGRHRRKGGESPAARKAGTGMRLFL